MAVASRRRRPEPEEDEEQETPRRRRRPVDDEEEQAAPRRRRPAPVDEDEYDDPTDEDDELEQAPVGRRRASRRASEEAEEPDRPRRRPGGSRGPSGPAGRRPGGSKPSGRVASGWGGYKKVKDASSDFEKKYKPSADGDVIALLEPEPFAAFARHWLDLSEGKRAFICPASLETEGDDDEDVLECPLCDVGDKPNTPKAYFNVAVLRPGSRPEHAVWEIGSSISDQLQTIDKSIGRKTPLTDVYLLASSSGSGLNTKYLLEPLFEEDLDEFDVKALTDKQLDSFELFTADLYEVPTLKELNKVADEIA